MVMEFGRHIGKGVWAFADKALPAIYGLGIVFLVIRGISPKEYGGYVVIQTIISLTTALGYALALQPLVKFVAEKEDPGSYIVWSILMQCGFFLIVALIIMLMKDFFAHLFDPAHEMDISSLMVYVPLLFLSAFYRNFGVSLLQATYRMQKIFWIDVVYFLGSLAAIYGARSFGSFNTAKDLLNITVVAGALSSVLAMILTRREMAVKYTLRKDTLREMWDFGKYTFGGSALYTMFAQMDIFFISSLAGVTSVAVYNAGKILTRLFDMMNQVISMFLLHFFSKHYSRREHDKILVVAEKTICFSTIFMIPVLLILVLFPGQVLFVLYHGKYDASAGIVRAFGLLALVVPWNAVISNYLVGIGKVKESFYIGVLAVCASIVGYYVATIYFGQTGTAIAYVVSLFAMTLIMYTYARRFIRVRITGVLSRVKDIVAFVRNRSFFPQREG